MRIGVLLLVCIAAPACKGPQLTYAPDASLAGAADDDAGSSGSGGKSGTGSGGACNVPKNSNSAPIGACLSAAKFVDCTFDSGTGCGCLSNGANSCTGCGPDDGATCVSKCANNQYAVSCGGPPSAGVTYDPVPPNCEVVATTPGGKSYACCSCE